MPAPELLATCWTTAGDAVPLPGRDASPVALADRIRAASDAGFTGFGLMHVDLEAYLREATLSDLDALLRDAGMVTVELEFLTDWWADGVARVESDRIRDLLLRASEALRPHHVKVGPDIEGTAYDLDRWAAEFRRLSQDFAEAGTVVALEFMPFSNIKDLAQGLELVRAADHPSGGLMLDLWHIERGGVDFAEVAALPLDVIKGVELDDGDALQVGDGYSDTVHRRRLCGEGDFRVTEFIALLEGVGYAGPWGVEILSEAHRSLPLADSVPAAYRTTADTFTLSRARGTTEGAR